MCNLVKGSREAHKASRVRYAQSAERFHGKERSTVRFRQNNWTDQSTGRGVAQLVRARLANREVEDRVPPPLHNGASRQVRFSEQSRGPIKTIHPKKPRIGISRCSLSHLGMRVCGTVTAHHEELSQIDPDAWRSKFCPN